MNTDNKEQAEAGSLQEQVQGRRTHLEEHCWNTVQCLWRRRGYIELA